MVFAFWGHIVFAQKKQTIVVRPETNLEKTVREGNDAVEAIRWFGEVFGEAMSNRLKKIRNSKYSVFVEKELENWKKKGGFETTVDWQRRLTDSTETKRSAIQESHINIYAKELGVSTSYDDYACKLAGMPFYHSGVYDADNEVLIVNTFWGNIPIPIPLDEAKNMQWEMQRLENLKARFFIQNDQLALLSLIYSNNSKTYTYENPSQSAQIARNKKLELERLDSLELATYNQKLDSIYKDYNRQLLQNPYNLNQKILTDYNKITGKDRREYNFNNSISSMQSYFERLNNSFREEYENEYRINGKLFANKDEFEIFYKQGNYPQEIEKRTVLNYLTANSKFIESMDFQKEKKVTVGSAVLLAYTGIRADYSKGNADRKKILSVINKSQNKPYYSQVMNFVIEINKGLNKEWSKNGKFFENKSEFYNAYLSNDYKKFLKSNKKNNVK
ncbi:hypothetical protein [Dysgonomonas sp. 520]|uniref:hypothetical protein n=1 Tax=Dysgonomonas sp. 520 TaxID=2302931 RepID=UPI001C876C4F|nr:hypothetical protein [Dysgonomonas sp. 520]NDW09046.1 hypothetical protein [Dysgonomonas sp. 520]